MNENRLDQILIRLGYINEDQIRNALKKQRIHGGRIGTHLLNNNDIDEAQLGEALSIQHQVPAFDPDRDAISLEFVKRLPRDLILASEALPIDYDAGSGILTMVVTDPKNEKSLAAVKRVIKCTKIRILVTPEAVFASLVAGLGIETEIDGLHKRVKLPDLFDQPDKALTPSQPLAPEPPGAKNLPQVLLVSNEVFLKNFLGPIFEREGLELLAPADGNEIRGHLNSGRIRKTLVAQELATEVRNWCRHRSASLPGMDIIDFSRISTKLLDSLASYNQMYRSLTQSLRIITETHASQAAFTPPYDLLREDIGTLARTLEMNRLAVDALQLAALLIVPTKTNVATKNFLFSPEDDFAGIDWNRTLEQAKFLHFPWPIDDTIRAFREILSERVNLKEFRDREPEMSLAAEIMTIVWYYFYGVSREPISSDSHTLTIKSELRKKSGLLARSEVIETYLRLIEKSSENLRATAYYQLFIVGKNDHNLVQFVTRLRHLGYHPIQIHSLDEAARMSERQPPTAIFIHEPSFPKEILVSPSLFKKTGNMALYAITMENDPSRMLNLFDAGFDDVFPSPHNMDLVAARLRKTTRETRKPIQPGSFQAAFSAFSFTDLLQGLSQGLKSVKVDLVRSNGKKATIYLNRGRLEHAACGELRGPEAIYEVITWLEDGEFIVEPTQEFPEQNIEMPLESVLMEGCRILDESRT